MTDAACGKVDALLRVGGQRRLLGAGLLLLTLLLLTALSLGLWLLLTTLSLGLWLLLERCLALLAGPLLLRASRP